MQTLGLTQHDETLMHC